MEQKQKSIPDWLKSWWMQGILVSLVLAVILLGIYKVSNIQNTDEITEEDYYGTVSWLYEEAYLLYHDLYNSQWNENKNYYQLYFQPDEGYTWMQEDSVFKNGEQILYEQGLLSEDGDTASQNTDRLPIKGMEDYWKLQESYQFFTNMENVTENGFSVLNNRYGYMIQDDATGFYLTNLSEEDRNRAFSEQYFYLRFVFHENGTVTIGENLEAENKVLLRRTATEVSRKSLLDYLGEDDTAAILKYGQYKNPVNCTVTYCISQEDYLNLKKDGILHWYGSSDAIEIDTISYGESPAIYYTVYETDYLLNHYSDFAATDDVIGYLLFLFLVMAVLGAVLPLWDKTKPWQEKRLCGLPLEGVLFLSFAGDFFAGYLFLSFFFFAKTGNFAGHLREALGINASGVVTVLAGCILTGLLTLFLFIGWYLGVSLRAVRELGIKAYWEQHCLSHKLARSLKNKAVQLYDMFSHFDVTKSANKMILKLVLVNAVILFIISSLWLGGFAVTLVYSVILYFVLRKYISDLQKKYGLLLKATNEIAQGNLNVEMTEDFGVFEPFKPQIYRIQQGFKNAVEEEVKSQKMKAELITNVSHDLKTPLTAIITYVNLLKEEGVTEEQRKEYLDTLERKSLRLKALIEDLFEISKANSQTITLDIMDVDLMNLIKQVSYEVSDKLEAAKLEVRMNLLPQKVILPLDSQKTYRIYENLFHNIAKYALPGTRVYVDGYLEGDKVIVTLKNISAQEITVDTGQLTERFVRGDASRNTEGSGLGLAIAKSFTQLQGGELFLEVDGDLFKVTTVWRQKEKASEEKTE